MSEKVAKQTRKPPVELPEKVKEAISRAEQQKALEASKAQMNEPIKIEFVLSPAQARLLREIGPITLILGKKRTQLSNTQAARIIFMQFLLEQERIRREEEILI